MTSSHGALSRGLLGFSAVGIGLTLAACSIVNVAADPQQKGSGGAGPSGSTASAGGGGAAASGGSGATQSSASQGGAVAPCNNGQKDPGESDVDCGGSCAPCGDGKICKAPADCNSTFCTDGVCCKQECGGPCMACSQAKTSGSDGVCNPIAKGSDPDNECIATPPEKCGPSGMGCNGSANDPGCVLWQSMTQCFAPICTSGTSYSAAYCSNGSCGQPTKSTCAPYACDAAGKACVSQCAFDPDCAKGYTCAAQKCVPLPTKLCGGANTDNNYNDSSAGKALFAFAQKYAVATQIARLEFHTSAVAGTTTVSIWSHDSMLSRPYKKLAEAKFDQSATLGWQGATFSTPVSIPAGVQFYVAWQTLGGEKNILANGTSITEFVSFDGGTNWQGPYSNTFKVKDWCN